MATLLGTIATLFLLYPTISGAYIGIHSNENRPITDDEIDRSLVPMIRIPRDYSPFYRGSYESSANDADETSHFLKATPAVMLESDNFNKEKSDQTVKDPKNNKDEHHIKNIVQTSNNKDETKSKKNGNKASLKSGNTESDDQQFGSEFLKPGSDVKKSKGHKKSDWIIDQEAEKPIEPVNDGKCTIDGNKVNNNEKIYENDCGKLYCRNGAVTWSLGLLSKGLPHCEGLSSIPSMYTTYASIRREGENDHNEAGLAFSKKIEPEMDNFQSQGKTEHKGIIDSNIWD